jgi:replicative DNA helicase
MAEGLSRQLQDSLLALLVFDDRYGPAVRAAIEVKHWDAGYRELVSRLYEYYDQYNKAPQDHAPELLDDLLQSQDLKLAGRYERILKLVGELRDRLNPEYLLKRVQAFVQRQSIKNAIIEAAPLLQSDDASKIETAWKLFDAALQKRIDLFDPGTRLSDKGKVLQIIDDPSEVFLTGILELDKRRIGPTRKGMLLLLGPAKGGKSWFLGMLGRMAAISGKRVVHITLEMSERMVIERYVQTFFSVAKRKDEYHTTYVKAMGKGLNRRLRRLVRQSIRPRLIMTHPRFRQRLSQRLDKARHVLENVYVKEFPTGELSLHQLEAYLDLLERSQNFVPDLLIVDYPDLMALPTKDYRLALGNVMKRLRGICVRRNLAGVVVSQLTRVGAMHKEAKSTHVAEDWSKIATADVVVVLQQTDEEKTAGLARLYVANARSEQDRFTVVVTQNLALGQFALTGTMLPKGYLDKVVYKDRDAEVSDASERDE